MASASSNAQKRTGPSSPRFYHPKPVFPTNSQNSFFRRTPSRTSSRTPRPLSPLSQATDLESTTPVPQQNMSPTLASSPTVNRPRTPFRPLFRHLSSTPSSGVSSIRSLSEEEESDSQEEIIMRSPLQIYSQDPEISESSDTEDILLPLEPTRSYSEKESSITIEELPALPTSPQSFTRHGNSRLSWGHDSGVEILKGEYSSCASSSEDFTTTDDLHSDNSSDEEDGEWDIDVCSSSYPTDAFLLGGLSALMTEGSTPRAFTPVSVKSNSLRGDCLTRSNSKRGNSFSKGRKRSYTHAAWSDNESDGEGDDESDDGVYRRVKARMTIDALLNETMVSKASNKPTKKRGKLLHLHTTVKSDLLVSAQMDIDE